MTTQAAESGGSPTSPTASTLTSTSFKAIVNVGRAADNVKTTASFTVREGYIPTLEVTPQAPGLEIVTVTLLPGVQDIGYSQSLTANGGRAPYTWTLDSGNLPYGLTLSSTGVISGTPMQDPGNGAPPIVAVSSFTVKVTDSSVSPLTAKRAIGLKISAPLAVATTAVIKGVVGVPYRQILSPTGGNPLFVWDISAGSLPAGLVLDASGTVSGVPEATGDFAFTARVTDGTPPAGPAVATRQLTLTVAPDLAISTSALPVAAKGIAYSTTVSSTGGNAPITWSIASGTLPPGLSLTAATGEIGGTPTEDGTFSFTLAAHDATVYPAPRVVQKSYAIVVANSVEVLTRSLPNATQNNAYSYFLGSRGGNAPIAWSITSGSLPAGLSLTAGTGEIAGTPTTLGDSTFTVQAADSTPSPGPLSASRTLTLKVTDGTALEIAAPLATPGTPTALPKGVVDRSYNFVFSATGGSGIYNWTLSSGTLHVGLDLNSDFSTASISGTPEELGSKTFTITITDFYNSNLTASQDFSLEIATDLKIVQGRPALAVTTAALPNAIPNAAYSYTLAVNEGIHPLAWQVTVGTLPGGITLSSLGVLSGTPTTPGSSSFTVQVVDSTVPTAQSATRALTLTVSDTLNITPTPFADGVVNQTYFVTLNETGGTPDQFGDYSWSLASGSLPDGLTLIPSGSIYGTPTTEGMSTFTLQVTDSASPTPATDQETFSITVTATAPAPPSLPSGVAGLAYSQTIQATGGNLPYLWSQVSVPAGLFLDPRTGVLSGTPAASGTSDISFTVRDDTLVAVGGPAGHSRTLRLAIAQPLVVATEGLGDGSVNAPYGVALSATGGNGPYTWSIVGGTLPAGISLSSAGVLNGTPTAAVTVDFRVRATDSTVSPGPATAERDYSITILGEFAIAIQSLPNTAVSVGYSQMLATAGGFPPAAWDVVGGTLPAGLTLDPSGLISGTPTTAGLYSFTVRALDQAEAEKQQTLSILVAPQLVVTTTSLSNASIGVGYGEPLAAAGGNRPLLWSLAAGSLPPGLNINATVGSIYGTPTTGGTYNFTIRATDSTLPPGPAAATQALSITVGTDTPPSAPADLAAVPGDNQIALSWTANPAGENVTKYQVFRARASHVSYALLSEVNAPTTAYTDTTATNGTPFFYALRAVNSAGLVSAFSSEASAVANGTDATAPEAPVITTPAKRTNDATPVVEGTAEPATLVEVLNGNVVIGSGSATAEGTWSIHATATLAPDGDYTLVARARDAASNQSLLSYPVVLTIDTTPPGLVQGATALAGNGFVDLFWQPNQETDLLGYDVWRSGTSNGTYTKVNADSGNGTTQFPDGGVVVDTKFRDKTVTNGFTYYYKITAVDTTSNETHP